MEKAKGRRKNRSCLFCLKNVDYKNKLECTRSMLNSCFRHLPTNIIGKGKTFEDFKSHNGPFCKVCYQAAKQLSRGNELLVMVEKEMKNFAFNLTRSILQNRKSPKNQPFKYISDVKVIIEVKKPEMIIVEDDVDDGDAEANGTEADVDDGDAEADGIESLMELTEATSGGDSVADVFWGESTLKNSIDVKDVSFVASNNNTPKKIGRRRVRRPDERKCDICGLMLKTKTHLNYHIVSKHTDEKPFECNVCGRKFKWRKFLELHSQTHLDVKKCPCAEEGCGKTFPNSNKLKLHVRLEHSEDSFKCEYCGFKTLTERRLAAHKARFHDVRKNFACNICGVRVSTHSALQTHHRRHTGEKPFGCDMCEESFRSATFLKLHYNRMHTDGKFKCPSCDYVGMDQHTLKHHSLVHSDDKPFICEFCGKGYKTPSTVLQHQRDSCNK